MVCLTIVSPNVLFIVHNKCYLIIMNIIPSTFYVYSDILEFNCQNLFRSLSYHMPIHMQKLCWIWCFLIAVINLLNQEKSLLRIASYAKSRKITSKFPTEKQNCDLVLRELVKEWHLFSLNTRSWMGWRTERRRRKEDKVMGFA